MVNSAVLFDVYLMWCADSSTVHCCSAAAVLRKSTGCALMLAVINRLL